MGSRADRHKQSFAAHPWCCFRGGNVRATEEDHLPSRILFDDRRWPEGYVFPACEACNGASRHDEQVVAMLSRIYPDPKTPKEHAAVTERIRAVAHNFPEIMLEMKPTSNQVRAAARRYG